MSVAFRLGRSDAEWAATRFGAFDPYTVKHEVADQQAVDRTHPVFFSVQETYERVTQTLEHLAPHEALVKVGKQVVPITTRAFPTPRASRAEIARVKDDYAQRLMTPRREITEQIDGTPEPTVPSYAPVSRRVPIGATRRHDLYEVNRREDPEAA